MRNRNPALVTVLFTVQMKDDLSQEQFITDEDSKVTPQMCLNQKVVVSVSAN